MNKVKRQSYYLNLATNLTCLFQCDLSLEKINTGLCWYWASLVKNMIPKAIICKVKADKGYHVFIKLQGLYFDAEHLTGVSDWTQLNSYSRLLKVNPIYSEGLTIDDVLLKHDLSFFDDNSIAQDMLKLSQGVTYFSKFAIDLEFRRIKEKLIQAYDRYATAWNRLVDRHNKRHAELRQ